MSFTPRLTAPTDFSTYYGSYNSYNRFSSYNLEGNCTWYAYGRTSEIAGRNLYNDFYITQPPGNGKDWIYNTWPAYTITSGSIDLQVGDILVWGGGTYGHVEVVEEINGNSITTSYSIAGNTWADSMFFNTRTIAKPSWGSPLGWVEHNDGGSVYLNNTFIGYIHNKYLDIQPTVTPSISITPTGYAVHPNASDTYVEFFFDIVMEGIPLGESASGGNTYPGLTRTYNTGWSYTTYTGGDGLTYRRATKQQTLHADKSGTTAYTITYHMYYNKTFSNGSINTDTLMTIYWPDSPVEDELTYSIWKCLKKKTKNFIIKLK